ncbi:MAG: DNA-binding protein, partial [Bacteroides graminisolvens]
MSNSVNYSVVERKNPSKKDAPMKFYAQAQSSGDVDTDEMARRIE